MANVHAAEMVGNMDWKPPEKLPDLRDSITPEAFRATSVVAARFAADNRTEIAGLPPRGLLVDRVFKPGPSDKIGIQKGDILLTLGGKPLLWYDDWDAERTAAEQPITFYSRGTKKEIAATLPAGPNDLWVNTHGAKLEVYFKDTPRNPKWNELLSHAAWMFRSEAPFAEACLKRALAAGCPETWEVDHLIAMSLAHQYRYQDAMAYANAALEKCPPERKKTVGTLFCSAALCSYKLEAALRVASDIKGVYQRHKENLKSQFSMEQILHKEGDRPTPSAQAASMKRDSLLVFSTDFTEPAQKNQTRDWQLNEVLVTSMMKVMRSTNAAYCVTIEQTAANIDASFEFKVDVTDNAPAAMIKLFGLSLVEAGLPDSLSLAISGTTFNTVAVAVTPDDILIHSPRPLFNKAWPLKNVVMPHKKSTWHSFRIVVVDGTAEYFFDQQRVFLGPVPPKRKFHLAIKNMGMSAMVRNIRCDELLTEQAYRERLTREVNTAGRWGMTRAHYIAQLGTLEEMKELLEFKPDLAAENKSGCTPLHMACKFKRRDIYDLLIAAGSPQDLRSIAAFGTREQIRDMFKTHGAAELQSPPADQSPLHYAALAGNEAAIKTLMELGADINHPASFNFGHRTALMDVAYRGEFKIFERMLIMGADVNKTDKIGRRVLDYAEAAMDDHTPFVDALLKRKALRGGDGVKPPAPPPNDPGEF